MQESPVHDAELDNENDGIGPLRTVAEVEKSNIAIPISIAKYVHGRVTSR